MELKELIKKRIEENVSHRDKGVIESYQYMIELLCIEWAVKERNQAFKDGANHIINNY
ncbi:hypothetical protein [Christiangramia crocea]|uniref:Uncharacterized protein n=1 Tax=Christiangramia crocea TaxID=2904124 RepID=A0A9X1UVE2_9FLAO|nr:hypothetical protein [Gramella crocea]MCG9971015.1 hypothetical protein [Gramella crocea]